jgi:hypothetical protein
MRTSDDLLCSPKEPRADTHRTSNVMIVPPIRVEHSIHLKQHIHRSPKIEGSIVVEVPRGLLNQIQSYLAGQDFTVKAIALDLARDVYRGPSSFGEFAGRHDLRQSDALCGIGGTLDFVMEIAKDMDRLLYLVREQSFLTLEDRRRAWKNDGNPTKLQHFRSNNETKKKYKG